MRRRHRRRRRLVDAEGLESATVRNSVVSNRLESRVVSNRLANRLGEDASRGDGVRESSRGDAPIERRDGERERAKRAPRYVGRRRRRVRHRGERSESLFRREFADAEPGGARAGPGIRRSHPRAAPRAPLRGDRVASASARGRGERLERGVRRGVVGLTRGAEERRDGGKRNVRRRRVDVLRRSVRAFRREHRANAAGGLVGDDRVAKRAARAKQDTVRDGSAKMKRRVRRRTVARDETRRRRGGVPRGKRTFRSTADAAREDDLARVRRRKPRGGGAADGAAAARDSHDGRNRRRRTSTRRGIVGRFRDGRRIRREDATKAIARDEDAAGTVPSSRRTRANVLRGEELEFTLSAAASRARVRLGRRENVRVARADAFGAADRATPPTDAATASVSSDER